MSSHDWSEGNKHTPFRKPFPHSDTDVRLFKIRFHALHLRLCFASGCFFQVPPPKSARTSRLINTYHMPLPTHAAVFYHPNARSADPSGRAV
jgi:hypothetical protein